MYACFSEEGANLFGSSIYLTLDGKEIEVTGVYFDPECEGYCWDDKVLLGPVERWVRHGRKGTEKLYDFPSDFKVYPNRPMSDFEHFKKNPL
jgi:hypothetical protein